MRKYSTEFGLNVYTSYKTLIPVEYLDKVENNAKYHIYGILATPRVLFDKDSIILNEKGVSCILRQFINDKEHTYKIDNFTILSRFDHTNLNYEIKYPYDRIYFKIEENILKDYYREYKCFINISEEQFLYQFNCPLDPQIILNDYFFRNSISLEMEVLYIGQSFGSNGERLAQDRLSSHSTLQKILTDCHSKYQEKRIFLLLLEMSPILNTTMDGISKVFATNDDEDLEHFERVLKNLPIYEQVINITEAALINYFKPFYNTNFIENFPNNKHRGYRQYFDLDYNCLSVELDLEFDNMPNFELYTEYNRIRCCWDFVKYNLFNDPNRENMYGIFGDYNE